MGQLFKSRISHCPIFIPAMLTHDVVKELTISIAEFQTSQRVAFFTSFLELFFNKFFAGNDSLSTAYADIPIAQLYLWQQAGICVDVNTKKVVNNANKFKKSIQSLSQQQCINKQNLNLCNKNLRTRKESFGIRTTDMIVGQADKVTYAFCAPPANKLNALLDDVLDFINNSKLDEINKALLAMLQIIHIHAFVDGNGRLSRALIIAKLQKHMGLINAYLMVLYFKIINKGEYYMALKSYRSGDVQQLKKVHHLAIAWCQKSHDVLDDILKEYLTTIKNSQIKSQHYAQLILPNKDIENHNIDTLCIELIMHKSKPIFVNKQLLLCLNKFDYYLKNELRKHNS